MNAFLELADRQMSSPVKAMRRGVEKRRATLAARNKDARAEAEKEFEDQDKLLKQWRRWHREREDALLAGPYGKDVRGLLAFCRTMTLSSAPALVRLVERAGWITAMDAEDRFTLLRSISQRIVRLREREGLLPYDDALPGEPPKAFHQIKTTLELDGR